MSRFHKASSPVPVFRDAPAGNVRRPAPALTAYQQTSRAGGHGENVEIVEDGNPISTNTTFSTPPPSHNAAYPEDSILDDFMKFGRSYSESEDQMLIGTILPVVARLLGRRVFIRFCGKKYPNGYYFLVTKPGLRKTTNIMLAGAVAARILPLDAFFSGSTSEEGLFGEYQTNPDRLWIEDEGNTLLAFLANHAAGQAVAKRLLKLYDCGRWQQTYIRQRKERDDEAKQVIEETSTSLLVGTTFNSCRFHKLETRDGMRRRVSYYLSERLARTIYWPPDLDGDEVGHLALKFKRLVELGGEMRLSADARLLWNDLQDQNRFEITATTGFDSASEAYGSALAEEGSKILKRAMLFEVCRWAKNELRDWQTIQRDTLALAAEHERYCLHASRELDSIGERAEIRNEADSILAKIRTGGPRDQQSRLRMTRSQLTASFAPHPERHGTMTPDRLYTKILPDLMKRRLAWLAEKDGKRELYEFLADETTANAQVTTEENAA
ncbi:MAG: hypothetical protein PCFJNLEI_00682 [Verrucomicrobiae bacterium]|nr:hypothetical protein [Verrucomicrobiae bacterium]